MKNKQKPKSGLLSSANIVLFYALFSALWIAVSDKLLGWLISDREWLTLLSMGKGFLFVALTSFLLYLLLNLNSRTETTGEQPLRANRLYWLFILQILMMPLIPALLYAVHGQQIHENSQTDLAALAKVKSEQVESWLQERLADGLMIQSDQAFAQAVILLNYGGSTTADAIQKPLLQLKHNKSYQSLIVQDIEGKNRLIYGQVPTHQVVGSTHHHGRINRQNLYTGYEEITTVWFWDENYHPYLDIRVPLRDTRFNEPVGMLIITQDLQANLLPVIQNWPGSNSTGRTLLLQPHDHKVSYIDIPANDVAHATAKVMQINAQNTSMLQQALADSAGMFEGAGLDGDEIIASYIPLHYSGWHLLVQQDRSEIYAPLYTLVYWITLIVFFAGLIIIFVVGMLWRQQQYTNQLELQRQTSEKDRLLRHFFELPLFGMAITHSQSGRWIRFNDHLASLLGYTKNEMAEHTLITLTPEEFQEYDHAEMRRMEEDLSDGFRCEKQLRRKDGERIFVNVETRCVRSHDRKIEFVISVIEDITLRKHQEETLRLSATVFDHTQEGILITDKNTNIVMANAAVLHLHGFSENEILNQNPRIFKSGKHSAEFYEEMWHELTTTGHWQGEIWNRCKNGLLIPLISSISCVYDEKNQLTHYVGVYTDIRKIKESEARLEYLAHYDQLTHLPNRTMLAINLNHAIELAAREQHKVALLILDLDRFKDVNDSFGHQIGDVLLQSVAQRLHQRLRTSDTICRLGGDEFTILLEANPDIKDIDHIADDILNLLKTPFHLPNGRDVVVGASIGISIYPDHGLTPEDLLQQADAAMYRAKNHGRSCFRYFSDELTLAAKKRLDLEVRLRRAIELNELRVYFQPQIDIKTNKIIGAEALVRWQEPAQGLISPALFIPVAEETGLIKPLGQWVLQETCRQGRCWLDKGLPEITLAVNISPVQFRYSNIQESVASALAQTGFPPSLLELELTESALMTHEDEAVNVLKSLREQGVRLAIDDFGTGYSSLAYLKRFPLDVLKIDKSFVDDIPHKKDDMEIAATIVAMAKTLRLKVLAEGVETPEQLAFLKEEGCDSYQGYLMSPPVPADKFEQLLRSQARARS